MKGDTLTDAACPNCGENDIEAGVLLDCRTGQKGYGCNACNRGWTTGELRRKVEEAA